LGGIRNAYTIFVVKLTKRPLFRFRRNHNGDVKTDLTEVGYDDADWIHLPVDKMAGCCQHCNEHPK
jgi:hypothetical protein